MTNKHFSKARRVLPPSSMARYNHFQDGVDK